MSTKINQHSFHYLNQRSLLFDVETRKGMIYYWIICLASVLTSPTVTCFLRTFKRMCSYAVCPVPVDNWVCKDGDNLQLYALHDNVFLICFYLTKSSLYCGYKHKYTSSVFCYWTQNPTKYTWLKLISKITANVCLSLLRPKEKEDKKAFTILLIIHKYNMLR